MGRGVPAKTGLCFSLTTNSAAKLSYPEAESKTPAGRPARETAKCFSESLYNDRKL